MKKSSKTRRTLSVKTMRRIAGGTAGGDTDNPYNMPKLKSSGVGDLDSPINMPKL